MPRMITSRSPETWQELETIVRDILRECGMRAECHVSLPLSRGSANVDVFAEDEADGVTHRIICECKYWTSPIPQTIIHGFRTVVQEAGVNRGYIISKAGFQSGATEAAAFTNIDLVTFEQFQGIYFDRWLRESSWRFERKFRNLYSYYEPFGIPGMGLLNDEREIEEYEKTHKRFAYVGYVINMLSPYSKTTSSMYPELPLDFRAIEASGIEVPEEVKSASAYRELFDILANHSNEALRELRKRNPITRNKPYDAVEQDD